MNWVEKEEQKIMDDKFKTSDKSLFRRICLYAIVAILCNAHAIFSCENVKLSHDIYRKWFRDEWTCPKKGCGYSNYDDIKYCALCGTKKP